MVRKIRYRDESPTMDMRTLRRLERVRNLDIAIKIRDDPGDGSPAHDTNRLNACRRIDPKGYNRGLRQAAPATGGIKPGWIIKLPAIEEPDGQK